MFTSGYGGETLRKGVTVESNDPLRPRWDLSISGEVMRFVTIKPKRIVMQGYGVADLRQSALIVPEPRFPFTITNVKSRQGDRFVGLELEKIRHNDRLAYRLMVINRQKEPGRYYETVTLETDSKIQPQLYVHVYGNILPAADAGPDRGKSAAAVPPRR